MADQVYKQDPKVVSVEEAEADSEAQCETVQATRYNFLEALFDVFIAILPLYFIVFAILGFMRRDTPANSLVNAAIFNMARLVRPAAHLTMMCSNLKQNPSLFPIVFTLVVAKFIKAVATHRLERGATVGLIEHLLGSRSLVSSVMTPVKLKTMSVLVPVLVFLWLCNPIGGQASLRVVTKAPNMTDIDAPFYYHNLKTAVVDTSSNFDYTSTRLNGNAGFNTAMMTPSSSKNGTQDIFGNLQVPMLEDLKTRQIADEDGWYSMIKLPESAKEAVEDVVTVLTRGAMELPKIANPIYVGLTGLPFLRSVDPGAVSAPDGATTLKEALLHAIQGPDVVSVESAFNLETSYMYLNCDVQKITTNSTNDNKTTFPDDVSRVRNGFGLTLTIDAGVDDHTEGHTYNSTIPRKIGFQSWEGYDADNTDLAIISEAHCDLTTTYVEARVYCSSNNNCSVTAIRESRAIHEPSVLTGLDGIGLSNLHTNDASERLQIDQVADSMASYVFQQFVNSTGETDAFGTVRLPIEYYFVDPVHPFDGRGTTPSKQKLYEIGSTLFSQRFTQLLNTYWSFLTAPLDMAGGFSTSHNQFLETTGKVRITQDVLTCHIPYFAFLIIISAGLFALGLTTAYLDATRRAPDVLDNFVNSLRHSPFIHVDHGPSLEDGKEKAKRLRQTKIRMGDVRPGADVGFVAIATPNEQQPVVRIQPMRHYA